MLLLQLVLVSLALLYSAAALPAQILTAAAVSGGLIYAGDRQAKGLSVNPFAALSAPKAPVMSDDYDHTAGVDVEATSV